MKPTTPQARLRGRREDPAKLAAEPARTSKPARTDGASEFSDRLPSYFIEAAGFHQITVPVLSIPSTQQGWYGLRRIRFEQDLPECQLVGYRLTMLPCDTVGSTVGGTTGIAWGDRRGMSAAIVIGQNLPMNPGTWSGAFAHIPGIESPAASPPAHTLALSSSGNVPRYIAVESFPTGSFADTTPNKITPTRTFAPFVYTFRQQTTLDIALVVANAHTQNNGTLIGLVDVRLFLSPIDGALTGRGTQ